MMIIDSLHSSGEILGVCAQAKIFIELTEGDGKHAFNFIRNLLSRTNFRNFAIFYFMLPL